MKAEIIFLIKKINLEKTYQKVLQKSEFKYIYICYC